MRAIGAAGAVLLVLVILLLAGFFIPILPKSSSTNYLVISGSGTVYESLSLNLMDCGAYYYTFNVNSFGQAQSSSGYRLYCNFQAGS